MLGIVVCVVVAALGARVAAALRQPPIIGAMIAGVSLGPLGVGSLAPGLTSVLFPSEEQGLRALVADVGVLTFVFLLGLHVDGRAVARQSYAMIVLSATSLLIPLLVGAGLSLWLFSTGSRAQVPGWSAALYCGCALGTTALPVLGAVIRRLRLNGQRVADLAVSCAAMQDLAVWSLLAVAPAFTAAGGADPRKQVIALVSVLALLLLRKPVTLLLRLVSAGTPRDILLVLGLAIGLLGVTAASQYGGLHALPAAFLTGVLVSPAALGERVRRFLKLHVERVTVWLLLPVFFLTAGLSAMPISLSGRAVTELAVVLAAAVCSKALGVLAAEALGATKRQDRGVLIGLLNTRGLTELVVIVLAAKAGVFDASLFTAFLIMALLTTLLATPTTEAALRRADRRKPGRALRQADARRPQ